METIEKSIEVEAPLSMVYNQWTQFEEFPEFMEGVKEVRQLDDKRLFWKAEIAGKDKEWHAEIFEQVPDQRIAWRATSGAMNTGMVNFESLGPNRTRVHLRLNYETEGAIEKMGDVLGAVSMRVQGDLKRFKEFIESRGTETGAWRGQIHGREVQSDAGSEPRSKRIHSPTSGTGSTGTGSGGTSGNWGTSGTGGV